MQGAAGPSRTSISLSVSLGNDLVDHVFDGVERQKGREPSRPVKKRVPANKTSQSYTIECRVTTIVKQRC